MEGQNTEIPFNSNKSSEVLNKKYLSSRGKKKYLKFVDVIDGNELSFKVICKKCLSDPDKKNKASTTITQSLKNGGTCNIRRHLKVHSGVIEELDGYNEDPQEINTDNKFKDCLTDFVVKNAISFRAIASPSFKKVVTVLNPSIAIPDRKDLSLNVSNRYEKLMEGIIESLKMTNVIAGTMDIWSKNNKSFLGCTAHFIDPTTLQRKNYTLSCRRIIGRHDYVNIGCSYYEILQEFDITDKMKFCSSDEAANMKKVFR